VALLVDDLRPDPGLDDCRVANLVGREVGEVRVYDGEIGAVTLGDRAGYRAEPVEAGAARRVGGQDRRQADGLLGEEGVAALAARNGGQAPVCGGMRPPPWGGGAHPPVAARAPGSARPPPRAGPG